MSTPASLTDARATHTRAPSLLPAPAERPRRRLSTWAQLLVLFALAAAYHAVQSTLHWTPAIFTDELLHSKLAQSLAAGEGFSVRGEPLFFPAFLPALLQAPAWLVDDMPTAYAIAKGLNALVMTSAVFPAYWLARQFVRPTHALIVAAATVVAPALVYHSYLLSEALAYPVFFLTLAVMVRALARPSVAWSLAVVGVCVLAVGTRVQFVALPIVFALTLLARRRDLRLFAIAAAGLALLAGVGLVVGSKVLGTYSGLALLDYEPLEVIRWAALTLGLLPFATGWLVLPAAILGVWRDRTLGFLVTGTAAVFLLQIGLVAAGDSERPLERYAIYLVSLAFLAFFVYFQRGAPHRRAYVAIALALGIAAWFVPLSSLADYRFSFDSPTLSAYGTVAFWIGHANAATLFAGLALLGGILLALRRLSPAVIAEAAVVLLAATGAVTYAGDHAMTERARVAWSAEPPDWLDRAGHGRADYLGLPGASPHFAWMTEAWNRDFGRPIWLDVERPRIDSFAASFADIGPHGELLVDGAPAHGRLLVVNEFASRIELSGEELERVWPRTTLLRVPDSPRVHSLTTGLYYDGWANGDLRHRTWLDNPDAGGVYRLVVALPAGAQARDVTAVAGDARRTVHLRANEAVRLELRVGHAATPLRVTSDRAELVQGQSANPRVVSFLVRGLEFEPTRRATSF